MDWQNRVGYFRVLSAGINGLKAVRKRNLYSQAGLYHSQMEGITGFVLAGGQSSRMGRDKALIELGGRTLLERALETASGVAGEVRIVGERAKYGAFGEVVEDVFSERGPLGGIHAALVSSSTDCNLILGVDLPLVTARFLQFLVGVARETEALVTVPVVGGKFEPLCAVYRKGFAGVAEHALAEGRNGVHELFSETVTRVVSEEEMVQTGFSLEIFRNLNTPDEVEQFKGS